MATIAELLDSRQLTRDTNNVMAGRRVFRVLNAGNEAGAYGAFNDDADAQIFPGVPELQLDRAEVTCTNGNRLWLVTATYSTAAIGKFRVLEPAEDPLAEPFFGWDYRREATTIPYMVQQTLVTRSGEFEATKTVFSVSTIEVRDVRIIRSLRVQFIGSTRQLDIIAAQDGVLHLIRGQRYLFTGAEVQQDTADQTKFLITYTWEQDLGTRLVASPEAPILITGQLITLPGANTDFGGRGVILGARNELGDQFFTSGRRMVRPPYTKLDVVQPEEEFMHARAVLINLYDYDDLGWQQLPGMVPL